MASLYDTFKNYTFSGGKTQTGPSVTGQNQSTIYKPPVGPSNVSAGVKTPQNTKFPTGEYDQVFQDALKRYSDPYNNPSNVNIKIDENIPSTSLNTESNPISLNEKRKGYENSILSSKYAREEEKLLKNISNLRSGIADLTSVQNREMFNAKLNPEGMFGPTALSSNINRLNEVQSMELNARTNQLQAYLDNLEMIQGYKPTMVGSPQIDDTTGEGFVYMQDPSTGEISVQSLGQITTPATGLDDFTLGKDQTRYVYNPETGSYDTYGGVSSGGVGGGTQFDVSNIDLTSPESIAALPVSKLTKAIMSGTGTMKDLTPTAKETVLQEMYSVGFNPQQYVMNRLGNLVSMWSNIPDDQKGLIQGAKFWSTYTVPEVGAFESAKNVLTRIVARLNDVGMLSDQDVADYKKAMPSRFDSSLDVVTAKVQGLGAALTGKKQGEQYTEGQEAELDDGTIVVRSNGEWINKFTGEVVNVE